MKDQHRRVTYRHKPGFLERVGNSCMGVLVGICVFLISIILLYYNEGRSVAVAIMLEEGLNNVASLEMSSKWQFNGKLVHHIGLLEAENDIQDDYYKIKLPCVKLKRTVEMYQWIEHSQSKETNVGDKIETETTYTYDLEWSSTLSQSRNFAEEIGHTNPRDFFLDSTTHSLEYVTSQGIKLSGTLIDKINWFKTIHNLPVPEHSSKATIHKHYFYHGGDPLYPEVGDTRTSFQCAGVTRETNHVGKRDVVSIVAMLKDDKFTTYSSNNGHSIAFLYRGSVSAEQIFRSEESSNSTLTWALRFIGMILMYVGLSIMTNIITTLVDWIPVVRQIVAFSVASFNMTLTLFLSLLVIAFGWLRFRPLFATTLAAASLLPWLISSKRARAAFDRFSR
uniref:Transmembrane protein 43 n=1 Tax=Ciona intestinalis TaxID=7719 RepID=A0A1W5BDE9_CIOIN|nr:transmembrane protein 43 [Ciona intestinalis]|eukprot:XP_002119557.1 transmembrane protein 43 [Ciona intestinalis]